jgi:methyl-accepting chemotaxis protein
MVEQTAAAARNLTGEVSALTEQADKFEIGEAKSRRAGYSSRGRAALMAA